MNYAVNIEFHDLKICANWSAPFNYVSSNLSDLKNKFEILMKIIQSTQKSPQNFELLHSITRWLTRWCQIKFIFSDLMFLYMKQWSSGMITGYDSDDLGSIPGRVNFLKFQIWIPLIFSHVLGYIYTHLDWNYHNHCGLVALYQSIELIHLGSIPCQARMLWEVLVEDIIDCWLIGCSLKRPRPWRGVRSGWL